MDVRVRRTKNASRKPDPTPVPRGRPVDLSDEQVHWDLGESQSYGEYLGLDAAPVGAAAGVGRAR